MKLSRSYIVRLFSDPETLLQDGVYFSGRRGEGFYAIWHRNQRPWIECHYKAGKLDGRYIEYHEDGRVAMRFLFRGGKKVKDLS